MAVVVRTAVVLAVALALLLKWARDLARGAPVVTLRPAGFTGSPHALTPFELGLTGRPFEAVGTADGRWIFVSLNPGPGSRRAGVAVLERHGATARLHRVVPLGRHAFGLALAREDSLLLVATGSGLSLLSTAAACGDSPGALLGTVATGVAALTVKVCLTADQRIAFTADEGRSRIGVIDLERAGVVGHVPVDWGPVGLALSPDGAVLYGTCMRWIPPSRMPFAGWGLVLAQGLQSAPTAGSVFALDVGKARQADPRAMIARVPAEGGPVRLTLSADGSRLWVTARGSNSVLAFDANQLAGGRVEGHLASATVGTAPVGLTLLRSAPVLVVANSNRFDGPNARQTLSVLDTEAVLAQRRGTVPYATLPAGVFPRELSLTPDGQLVLLTNFGSCSLSLIPVAQLPTPTRAV